MQRRILSTLFRSYNHPGLPQPVRASVAVQSAGSGTGSAVPGLGLEGLDQVQVREGDELVLQQFPGRGGGLGARRPVIQRPVAMFEVRQPLGQHGIHSRHSSVPKAMGYGQECIQKR